MDTKSEANAAAKAREQARRKDGKFGVQQKAESGLFLTLPTDNRYVPQLSDFTVLPPASEYTDVRDDDGRLIKRKYLVERDGNKAECLEVYYPRTNQLQSCIYRDTEGFLVRDAHIPHEVYYFPNGALDSVSYSPRSEYLEDYLQGGCESFLFSEEYSADGALQDVRHFRSDPNGLTYASKTHLSRNGNVEFVMNYGTHGLYSLHRDIPSFESYYANGQVKRQEWSEAFLFHREGAPAVIEYNPDGSVKEEKYYREGKEVPPPTINNRH